MKRIRHRTQFDAVLAGPPLVKTTHFALHRAILPQVRLGGSAELFPGEGPWLGVLIPKRWARRAVTRNALRRQIYAVAQELSPALSQQAWVVRLRAGFARQEFVSASSAALKAAARAELLQLLGEKLAQRLQSTDRTTAPKPVVSAGGDGDA